MSAPGGVVLVATALVGSPLVWMLHTGQITLDDAAVKLLVVAGIVWFALTVVSSLAWSPGSPRRSEPESRTDVPSEPRDPVA